MNKKRQTVCVIAAHVVVMHAAALALVVSSSPVQPIHRASGHTTHGVMHARLDLRAAPPTVMPAIDPAIDPVVPAAPSASEDRPSPPAAELQAVPAAEETAVASTEEVQTSSSHSAEQGDNYLPRPLLSMPPRTSAPVIVPFPEQITSPGRYTTILALFIDEDGVVRRVRIDGPSLPKPMEDAARDSFLQARFSPGEVDGQQVKSLIRVEVVFDNTPIESMAQAPTL